MKNILYITVIDSYLQYYHNRKKKIINKKNIYIYINQFLKNNLLYIEIKI